jgi:hypothetical protein
MAEEVSAHLVCRPLRNKGFRKWSWRIYIPIYIRNTLRNVDRKRSALVLFADNKSDEYGFWKAHHLTIEQQIWGVHPSAYTLSRAFGHSQLPYSVNHVSGKIGKLCVRSYLVTRIYIHQKVRSSPCFRAQMYLGDYVETWLILLTLRSLATSDRDRQAFFPDQLVQVVGLLL